MCVCVCVCSVRVCVVCACVCVCVLCVCVCVCVCGETNIVHTWSMNCKTKVCFFDGRRVIKVQPSDHAHI